MKVLVIDNYDSFTYNLVHQLSELGVAHYVVRNDQIDIGEVANYDKIIFSPGPGIPDEAGSMKQIIQRYLDTKSILGVCLGHQAIAEVCGARLQLLEEVPSPPPFPTLSLLQALYPYSLLDLLSQLCFC